jgi:hypothetical protein
MRALILAVSSFLVLLSSAPASAALPSVCDPIAHCQSAITCPTDPAEPQCSACDTGFWLSEDAPADSCVACTEVDSCVVQETCTSALDSRCAACDFGYYLDDSGPASVCAACPTIPSCTGPGGCMSAATPQCTQCASGHYLVDGPADNCPACTDVDHCSVAETCTTASNSFCGQCESGYWRSATLPTVCTACTAVPHCLSALTCTTAGNSVCSQCEPGYFLTASGQCEACTDVSFCLTTPLSCTSATTSRCGTCAVGRYLDASARPGGADVCAACSPVANCSDPVISCTTNQDSRCNTCATGYYRVSGAASQPDTCVSCPTPPGCVGAVTCTSPGDAQCSACAAGYYLDPMDHLCKACANVDHCTVAETCSTASNSICAACETGYWRSTTVPTVCTACSVVSHCTSALTCTTAASSVCTACDAGFFLAASGQACPACTPVPHCVSALTCTTASNSTCTACEAGYVLAGGTCHEACTAADDCSSHGTPAANGYRPASCACVCDVGWEGPACDVESVLPTPAPTPTIAATALPTPGPTATLAPEALNHFLCYETQERALNLPGVALDDGAAASTVKVKRAMRLCVPANKNGEDPSAIDDPAHLSAYTIKQTSPRFIRRRGVVVTPDNPIFPPLTVDLVRPDRLLVAAAKSDGSTPPPALAAPIDDYECYRVKGGRSRISGVTLETKLGTRVVDIKRPLHLCTPVSRNSGSLVDPVRDLMCYQVRTRPLQQPATPVSTTNGFQSDTFVLFGLRELCVPTVD